MARSLVISRAARSTVFDSAIELGRPAGGLLADGADVVVGDAELAADLDVMGVFVRRLRQIADLQDRKLAQPRIELALVADVHRRPAIARAAFGLFAIARLSAIGRASMSWCSGGRSDCIEIGNARHCLSFQLNSALTRHPEVLGRRPAATRQSRRILQLPGLPGRTSGCGDGW